LPFEEGNLILAFYKHGSRSPRLKEQLLEMWAFLFQPTGRQALAQELRNLDGHLLYSFKALLY